MAGAYLAAPNCPGPNFYSLIKQFFNLETQFFALDVNSENSKTLYMLFMYARGIMPSDKSISQALMSVTLFLPGLKFWTQTVPLLQPNLLLWSLKF